VAFLSAGTSVATNAFNPTNLSHAYVRDVLTGNTVLVNRAVSGGPSSRGVVDLKISGNGRYVVFTSFARDLVADDTNDAQDVFRRDLETGTTIRLSVTNNGQEVTSTSSSYDARLDISRDGRWVTFLSPYDMVDNAAPTPEYYIYLCDAQTREKRHLVGAPGQPALGYGDLSESGEYYAYAPYLVAPAQQTIIRYDLEADQQLEIFRFDQSPAPAGLRQGISISEHGRFVAFSLNSVALTGSSESQVWLIDADNPGTTTLVSGNANGPGNGASLWPKLSADGRYILFWTTAPSLTNDLAQSSRPYLMRKDLQQGTVPTIASRDTRGNPVYVDTNGQISHALSSDGSMMAFVGDNSVVGTGTAGSQVFVQPIP
jgi:Tol biopolymer transport system component